MPETRVGGHVHTHGIKNQIAPTVRRHGQLPKAAAQTANCQQLRAQIHKLQHAAPQNERQTAVHNNGA